LAVNTIHAQWIHTHPMQVKAVTVCLAITSSNAVCRSEHMPRGFRH